MKYIIDTDPGIDDAIAIMLGIKNNLNVIGFTLASGNIPIAKSENNLKIIEDFLNTNIPIYKGSIINECHKETAEFAHGKDGLGYAVFPKQKTRVVEKEFAEDYIIKASKKYTNNLTIICLGPLTNIAKAIIKDPSLPKRIKNIIIMGTSYNPNETSPYIEFNVRVDIPSAQIVFNAPFPNMHIITHEVGIEAFIEKDYILNLRNSDNLLSRFVGNISEKYIEFSYEHYKTIGLGTPDPITIASEIDSSIINYLPAKVEIIANGESKITILKESNLLISTDFDLDKFRTLFKKTFN